MLFFGLLRPYKGIETLLEAWRGIDDAELWIVGRPMMPLEPLRRRPAPRPARRAVRPAVRLRRRAAGVLPSCRRGRCCPTRAPSASTSPGVLATALAFGKPVVLSDIGGFGEVADAGAARLVPPDDSRALREALSGLLADPPSASALSEAAAAAAARPYSWDAGRARDARLCTAC